MDLAVVRMLRDAIRTTAAAAGGGGAGSPLSPVDRFEQRATQHPAPRIAPRPVIHTTPRFQPRQILRPAPVFQDAINPPFEAETPAARRCGPFEPVWKKLPPIPPRNPPATVVKAVQRPTDILHKGTLIDFFV